MTRFSNYFIPCLKNDPADAEIASHKLMIRAGMIRQLASGIYNWLPLGLQVLKNVEEIIRREMVAAGASELFLPMVQPAELWQEGGRWEAYDDGQLLAKFSDRKDNDYCLGPTHELVITDVFRQTVQSYKDLPMMLFQIQTKFRDEFRPQYGTIRPREFLMKDCYSFDIDKTSSLAAYNAMVSAYHKICQEIGLDYQVVEADSGSIGGNHSHEFHALSDTGMDTLLIHPESNYAINTEKFDPDHCPYAKDELIERQGIEIGHCFHLGTTYSKTLNACFTDRDGEEKHVSMGCYGIGVSRLIGAIIEQYHDDNGIRWPASVAPYDVVVLNLRTDDSHHSTISEDMYQKLRSAGLNVLLDDRNTSVGQKLNEADLIGIPWQCIIGPKSLENKKCEWKNRHTDVTKLMPFGQWPKELTSCA